MMKKLLVLLLTVSLCLGGFFPSAAAEGTDTVQVPDGNSTVTLSITECGFTNEEHSAYSVTVSGYNALLTGKEGIITDIMPFRVAIAWNTKEWIETGSFALTLDPVTIAQFEKSDHTTMEEPLYVLIAPKGTPISNGWCYVIAEGRFHDPAEKVLPTPAPAPKADSNTLKTVGAHVIFGSYPQEEEGEMSPIEWIVLDYDETEHKALLLSKYGLDAKKYNQETVDFITWEQCSLRQWLNNDFMITAFTAEEQSAILTTTVDNSSSQGYSEYSTNGGNNTQDKVFLLSYHEAFEQYFSTDESRMCAPTDYAIPKGFLTNGSDEIEGRATGSWWLRSPGCDPDRAALVSDDGSRSYSFSFLIWCVRPALWVSVESGIF